MTQKKYKLCRRLGAGIYEKCQTQKFAKSEPMTKKGKKPGGRRSDYGNQLIEKQKVRFMYGVREKQFGNYVDYAMEHAKKGTAPAELLFRQLEERLDNAVYRLGFAHTRALARQMVSHGHFTVNGKKLTIPSYSVKTSLLSAKEVSRQPCSRTLQSSLKISRNPTGLLGMNTLPPLKFQETQKIPTRS